MAGGNFTFRNFMIRQDRCAMKVGTDGVLLGAWAAGGSRILDIGTGTSLIALMMAQRFGDAMVKAVETDHDAATQAAENVAASPYADRVEVIEGDIQAYHTTELFDCIVSNPPYFCQSMKNPDTQRATARHADSLTYGELFASVRRLLAPGGEFSAVIPDDCLERFTGEAYMAGLTATRRTAIRTTPRKAPKRHLLAFGWSSSEPALCEEQCLMTADGQRTDWYSKLTADFYIK